MSLKDLLRRPTLYCTLVLLLLYASITIALFIFNYTALSNTPSLSRRSLHRSMSENNTTITSSSMSPTIQCLLCTSSQYHSNRAVHVQATWLSTCTSTLIVSSIRKPIFPFNIYHDLTYSGSTADLFDPIGTKLIYSRHSKYSQLWGKVLDGFMMVNASRSEWFLKTDDDTYVVMDNLRQLLSQYNSTQPLFLGLSLLHNVTIDKTQRQVEYMSGGPGYVLSQGAVELLQEGVKEGMCGYKGAVEYEDVNMGICLGNLGVDFIDTRDKLERATFLPYPPWVLQDHRNERRDKYLWLQTKSKYRFRFGTEYISDKAVSFHEIRDPVYFYILDYFIKDLNKV